MKKPKRPNGVYTDPDIVEAAAKHLGDWSKYADALDDWLREEVLKVLRDHRNAFQSAVNSFDETTRGPLRMVLEKHRARIEAIDALIAEIEANAEESP